MRIAVFGLGYVGCVSAACMANFGHRISGVDADRRKVDSIMAGKAPFYEPCLDALVAETVKSGKLKAFQSAAEGLADAEVALVCVGTPSEKNGNLGLDQLRRVVADIAACAAHRTEPLIVAIRSTVFPGTCEEIVIPALAGTPCTVVSNPEFLREGVAVKDFLDPGLIVVGGCDRGSVQRVADIYAGLPCEPRLVALRTAEMIKYACNSYHAVKIAFANEIGALSRQMGIDGAEVMATLCSDEKLNSSAAYLKPGFAFGGSCLPKDLRALSYRARQADVHLPLLDSALPSNAEHLKRATDDVLDHGDKKIGVLGLAFKEDTDDLRESPVITLLETLIGKGRSVRVYDPHIQIDVIYGTNRSFILHAIPHIGKLMVPTVDELLEWSEVLVVAQKLAPEASAKVRATGSPVLNLV